MLKVLPPLPIKGFKLIGSIESISEESEFLQTRYEEYIFDRMQVLDEEENEMRALIVRDNIGSDLYKIYPGDWIIDIEGEMYIIEKRLADALGKAAGLFIEGENNVKTN